MGRMLASYPERVPEMDQLVARAHRDMVARAAAGLPLTGDLVGMIQPLESPSVPAGELFALAWKVAP